MKSTFFTHTQAHVRTLPSESRASFTVQSTVRIEQDSKGPLGGVRRRISLSLPYTLTGLVACILLYEMYYQANNPLNAQSEVERRFYKSVDERYFHGCCPYSDLARCLPLHCQSAWVISPRQLPARVKFIFAITLNAQALHPSWIWMAI